MKNYYMSLKIKSWDDAYYLKIAIRQQIKFYGRCGRAAKHAGWLDENKRNYEFLDCVKKVKMFVGYYREISKKIKRSYL